MIELSGQIYQATVGSDLQRDGMYLEVKDSAKALVAEVFYCDQNDSMTFTGHRPDISLELVEWMIAQARERLAPVNHATANQPKAVIGPKRNP